MALEDLAATAKPSSDAATCSICLASVERLETLQCMSCVCEAVFHAACLEKVPRVDGGRQRRCPNCRQEGRRVAVEKVLAAYLGVGHAKLDLLRKRLRYRLKVLRLRQKKVCCIPRRAFQILPRKAQEGIRCSLCLQMLDTFRDVSLLGCSCASLVHAACLPPPSEEGSLVCCERCREPLSTPSAVSLKSITQEYVVRGHLPFVEKCRAEACARASLLLRAVGKQLAGAGGKKLSQVEDAELHELD